MIHKTAVSVLLITENEDAALTHFIRFLNSMPHVRLSVQPQLPQDLNAYPIVVTAGVRNSTDDVEHLARHLRTGGAWLKTINSSDDALPDLFGVQPESLGSAVELRVLFDNADHPLALRLPEAIYLNDCRRVLTRTAADAETILYADWHCRRRPVLTHRRVGAGSALCTALPDCFDPGFGRVLYRLFFHLAGNPVDRPSLGVGILGYAPSVGPTHGLGTQNTPGLNLRAICDLNPDRLSAAVKDFPDVKAYRSAGRIAADPDVDLVIVATPPNTHADLCLQMMSAGKHVVSEKPLALNNRETAAMLAIAAKHGVHLSCHQNRRWDPDYLAIKQALADGLIGDLFYMETFVGGFQHPCGYWHSHASVSGGLSYDWGAHYLDWIVSLMPEPVETVVGTRHKRVWPDVTNADQERIQIRFAGGTEAEFMHSDMAAARKPKWYLLGTKGAIVGHWRDVASYEIDPVLYFQRHEIPATEMAPDITVFSRRRTGEFMRIKPPIPERNHFQFHGNLADHLLLGEALAAPLDDSVKVVAILEAAARSMAKGGTVEVISGG